MERWKRDVEEILKKNWPVDGPFLTTLDEMANEVRSKFGMPSQWLNTLMACISMGFQQVIDRRDREELTRLAIRMYLTGLLTGADWQAKGWVKEAT